MPDVSKLIKRQSQLASNRATFEQQWVEVLDNVGIAPNDFYNSSPAKGQKTTYYSFDSTSQLALSRFVAALSATLTPSSNIWHKLTTQSPQLRDNYDVSVYLDQVNNLLFAARYDAAANFSSQINECYSSLGLYGTACIFVEDDVGKGIRYKSIPLSQLYIAENSSGIVDTVFRKFKYTAAQAYDAWGDKISDKLKSALDANPDNEYWFLHACYPNPDYDSTNRSSFKFYSCYVDIDAKQIITEGGFRTMPYAVSRYQTQSNEIYGRGPAIMVLPDIKILNRMRKANLKGIEKAVDPALLATDDLALNAINLQAGGINYGAVDSSGRPMIQALQTGARIDVGDSELEQSRKIINDAFLVSLFQILVESNTMTATEVEYRQQEKGEMLAPVMGRQQSELLAPMIARELDILSMYNLLPPMPDELIALGGNIQVKYDAPLNKEMRNNEVIAILNTLQTVAAMAPFDPSVTTLFDTETAIRIVADVRGVPPTVLRSKEQVQAMQQQQQMQQAQQQMLQAAPVLGDTARSFAQAGQANAQTQQTPPGGAM